MSDSIYPKGSLAGLVTIRLPWPGPLLSPNGSHGHWSPKANAKKAYRDACYIATCEWRHKLSIPAEGQFVVWLQFVPPPRAGAQRLDKDNLIARMKAGLDGVSRAMHIDDSRFNAPLVEIMPPATSSADAHVLLTVHPDGRSPSQPTE